MLSVIDWRIDYKCDNNCDYCFGNKHIAYSERIDEKCLHHIEESDIKYVVITGGEPTIDLQRCCYIIDRLYAAGKKIYFSTNGYQLDQVLKSSKNKIHMIGFPLDGYDEDSNMIHGRNPDSFNKILSFLINNSQDYKVKIGTVVSKRNLSFEWLNNIVKLLDNYPISIWRIYEVLPENRAFDNRDSLLLNSLEREVLREAVSIIKKERHNFSIELVTRDDRSASYLIIQPDGTVMIPFDNGDYVEERVIGDLNYQCLEEIVESDILNQLDIYSKPYLSLRHEDML